MNSPWLFSTARLPCHTEVEGRVEGDEKNTVDIKIKSLQSNLTLPLTARETKKNSEIALALVTSHLSANH